MNADDLENIEKAAGEISEANCFSSEEEVRRYLYEGAHITIIFTNSAEGFKDSKAIIERKLRELSEELRENVSSFLGLVLEPPPASIPNMEGTAKKLHDTESLELGRKKAAKKTNKKKSEGSRKAEALKLLEGWTKGREEFIKYCQDTYGVSERSAERWHDGRRLRVNPSDTR